MAPISTALLVGSVLLASTAAVVVFAMVSLNDEFVVVAVVVDVDVVDVDVVDVDGCGVDVEEVDDCSVDAIDDGDDDVVDIDGADVVVVFDVDGTGVVVVLDVVVVVVVVLGFVVVVVVVVVMHAVCDDATHLQLVEYIGGVQLRQFESDATCSVQFLRTGVMAGTVPLS
jgi:hypothetical protein